MKQNKTQSSSTRHNSGFKDQLLSYIFAAVRIVIGAASVILALACGLHYSSFFLLGAAFLLFHFSLLKPSMQKIKMKAGYTVILAVILLLIGVLTSPVLKRIISATDVKQKNESNSESQSIIAETSDTTFRDNESIEPESTSFIEANSNDSSNSSEEASGTAETASIEETEASITEESTTLSESDAYFTEETDISTETDIDLKEETDISTETHVDLTEETGSYTQTEAEHTAETDSEKEVFVWVSASGTKYHSVPTCSNMKAPKQITLEEAEESGYEPCKKCH
jgi:hypothetical protein